MTYHYPTQRQEDAFKPTVGEGQRSLCRVETEQGWRQVRRVKQWLVKTATEFKGDGWVQDVERRTLGLWLWRMAFPGMLTPSKPLMRADVNLIDWPKLGIFLLRANFLQFKVGGVFLRASWHLLIQQSWSDKTSGISKSSQLWYNVVAGEEEKEGKGETPSPYSVTVSAGQSKVLFSSHSS